MPDLETTKTLHQEVLYTAVRVLANRAAGSGTVIYSEYSSKPSKGSEPEYESLILTNHHVIEDLITVQKQWNPVIQRDCKKQTTATARAEFFEYKYLSREIGTRSVEADIVVPSRIAVTMQGFSSNPITHMSYFIPITTVYKFLEAQMFQYIYDDKFTSEQCAKMRRKAREDAEEELLSKTLREGGADDEIDDEPGAAATELVSGAHGGAVTIDPALEWTNPIVGTKPVLTIDEMLNLYNRKRGLR